MKITAQLRKFAKKKKYVLKMGRFFMPCKLHFTKVVKKKKKSHRTEHAKAQMLKWLTDKTSVSSTSSLNVAFMSLTETWLSLKTVSPAVLSHS